MNDFILLLGSPLYTLFPYTTLFRSYPATLPALEYPGHFLVKPVTAAGNLRFKHKLLFIAHALAHHRIGFDEVARSEEHTSELQSRLHLVCRLLLEKKKTLKTIY